MQAIKVGDKFYVRGLGIVRRPQYLRFKKYGVAAHPPGGEYAFFSIKDFGSMGDAFLAAQDHVYDEEGELRYVRKLRSKELDTKITKVGVPGVIWEEYTDPAGKKSYRRFSVRHPIYTGLVYTWYIPKDVKDFPKEYVKAKREAIAKRTHLAGVYNSPPRVVKSFE